MVFQKGKPRPPMKVKTCAICRKSFQPSSGAQKICGEPAGKDRSRMQKYLDKKAKETRQTCVIAPITRKNTSDVPDLELDLSPLAAYVKAIVDRSLNDREVTDLIREVVREEIASRLKPLFGQA